MLALFPKSICRGVSTCGQTDVRNCTEIEQPPEFPAAAIVDWMRSGASRMSRPTE